MNDWVNDTRLSFRARGLLGVLLANPDLLETSQTKLCDKLRKQSPSEGRSSIKTSLNELIRYGYIDLSLPKFRATRLQDGKPGYVYVLFCPYSQLTKIGSTKNLAQRLKSLKLEFGAGADYILTVKCSDMGATERHFQTSVESHHVEREMFNLGVDIDAITTFFRGIEL